MQAPRNRSQLRSFLGMAGYFRTNVPNFARRVKVLTEMLRGSQLEDKRAFQQAWGRREQDAFDGILEDIQEVEMLSFIDYSKPIMLRTDASKEGCGAVLFQVVDGQEKPVAFLSKTFSQAESNWSTIEQETFAVYTMPSLSGRSFFLGISLKSRPTIRTFCGCTSRRLPRSSGGECVCKNMISL